MNQSPLPILLLVVVAASLAYGSEPIRLSYSLPVGTTTRYQASSTQGQSLTVMGRDVISEVRTDLGLTLIVKDKLLQSCSLQLLWSDGKLTTRTIGHIEDVKTDSVMTVPTYGLAQNLVITPTGMIVSSTASASIPQQTEVLDMIQATNIPDRIIVPFPSAPVVPGYRWSVPLADTSDAPQGRGTVITSGTTWYTYRGSIDTLGRKCWLIEISSNDLAQHGTLFGAAIEMRIDGSGNLHGMSIHDARTGLLMRSATQLETNVVMASVDQSLQKITVPVRSQINVVIDRVEGKGW